MTCLVLAALLQGCATSGVPPSGSRGNPFLPGSDERALWSQAEQEEAQLDETGEIYADPSLEEYLERIAATLLPPEVKDARALVVRVTVLRDPTLNAFAMPNGRLYIHSGLLARVENEAQLAAVLGHELAHVTDRHALRVPRDARGQGIAFTESDIWIRPGLRLAALAAASGYGCDLEREADREGIERMVAAGYDPSEVPRMLERLEAGHDSSKGKAFFWGNHARLEERITTTTELLRTRYRGLDTRRLVQNTEEFARHTRLVVRENAALDIRAGRFGLAREQLGRVLTLAPEDPVAHLLQGDLYRLEAQRARRVGDEKPLLAEARQAYERAAALDPAYADPFRQLGFLYYQSKENDKATAAFREYLSLRPDAPDARRIKEYVVELGR